MTPLDQLFLLFCAWYILRQLARRGITLDGSRAWRAVRTGAVWAAQILPYRGPGFHGWVTHPELDAPLNVNSPFFIHMCRLYGPPCDWPLDGSGSESFGIPKGAFVS